MARKISLLLGLLSGIYCLEVWAVGEHLDQDDPTPEAIASIARMMHSDSPEPGIEDFSNDKLMRYFKYADENRDKPLKPGPYLLLPEAERKKVEDAHQLTMQNLEGVYPFLGNTLIERLNHHQIHGLPLSINFSLQAFAFLQVEQWRRNVAPDNATLINIYNYTNWMPDPETGHHVHGLLQYHATARDGLFRKIVQGELNPETLDPNLRADLRREAENLNEFLSTRRGSPGGETADLAFHRRLLSILDASYTHAHPETGERTFSHPPAALSGKELSERHQQLTALIHAGKKLGVEDATALGSYEAEMMHRGFLAHKTVYNPPLRATTPPPSASITQPQLPAVPGFQPAPLSVAGPSGSQAPAVAVAPATPTSSDSPVPQPPAPPEAAAPPPATTTPAAAAAAAAAVADKPSARTTPAAPGPSTPPQPAAAAPPPAPPENPLFSRIRSSDQKLSGISKEELLEAYRLTRNKEALRDIYEKVTKQLIVKIAQNAAFREGLPKAELENLIKDFPTLNLSEDHRTFLEGFMREIERESDRRNRLQSSFGATAAGPSTSRSTRTAATTAARSSASSSSTSAPTAAGLSTPPIARPTRTAAAASSVAPLPSSPSSSAEVNALIHRSQALLLERVREIQRLEAIIARNQNEGPPSSSSLPSRERLSAGGIAALNSALAGTSQPMADQTAQLQHAEQVARNLTERMRDRGLSSDASPEPETLARAVTNEAASSSSTPAPATAGSSASSTSRSQGGPRT